MVLSDYYGLSDDANAKATLLAEAQADYDYEAMRVAAAKTAETVDADYQALIPGGSYEGEDGDSGDLGGGIIEDIQKEVDPNVVAAVSSSLPTGYDFLGSFNAEADEVEADLYRVDYTPGNTPFTVTNYGSNDGIIRISSAAFDGTLADGKAVSDAVLAKYDIPDVRENSTMGGVAVLVADYGDPTYGPFTSVVFVYNGTWYSVAGSITVEQATTIVQELIGQ